MKKILTLTGLAEAGTGVVLLADPAIVVRQLFAAEIVGAGILMSRIAGIALIGLGVACWPGPPLVGMLTYSVAVAAYLGYVGLTSSLSGTILWPAVALHVILAILLARTLRNERSAQIGGSS